MKQYIVQSNTNLDNIIDLHCTQGDLIEAIKLAYSLFELSFFFHMNGLEL